MRKFNSIFIFAIFLLGACVPVPSLDEKEKKRVFEDGLQDVLSLSYSISAYNQNTYDVLLSWNQPINAQSFKLFLNGSEFSQLPRSQNSSTLSLDYSTTYNVSLIAGYPDSDNITSNIITLNVSAAQDKFTKFKNVISAKCIACHTGYHNGWANLATEDDWKNSGWVGLSTEDSSVYYRLVGSTSVNGPKNMPKSPMTLSASERSDVKAWLDEALTVIPPADTTAPSTPVFQTSNILSSITQNSITVSWNAGIDPSGIKEYVLYRNNLEVFRSPSILSFNDTGLSASTDYLYKLEVYDNSPAQNMSSTQFTFRTAAPVQMFPNITSVFWVKADGTKISDLAEGETIDLNNPNFSSFSVQVNIDRPDLLHRVRYNLNNGGYNHEEGAAPYTLNGDNTPTSIIPYTFPMGSHNLKIEIINTSMNVSPVVFTYNFNIVRIDNIPPTASTLTALALSSSSIQLNWTTSSDIGGSGFKEYQLYRNNILIQSIADINTLSFTDTGLNSSTTYNYHIKSVDNALLENTSNTASATTPMAAGQDPFVLARQVLDTRCLSCHQNGSQGATAWNIAPGSDQDTWVNNQDRRNLVVPSKPMESAIVKWMRYSGLAVRPTMPPGANDLTFPRSEYDKIFNWIGGLAPEVVTGGTPIGITGDPILMPKENLRLGDRDFVYDTFVGIFGPTVSSDAKSLIKKMLLPFGGACISGTSGRSSQEPVSCLTHEIPIDWSSKNSGSFDTADEDLLHSKHWDLVDAPATTTPLIGKTSVVREGYRTYMCEKALLNDTFASDYSNPLFHAISKAKTVGAMLRGQAAPNINFASYPAVGSTPTDQEIKDAYYLFYNFKEPDPSVITAIKNLAQAAAGPSVSAVNGYPKRFEPWRYVFLSLCMAPDWQEI